MILDSYDDKLFAQLRDKTLVLLLLDTGLRINEASLEEKGPVKTNPTSLIRIIKIHFLIC